MTTPHFFNSAYNPLGSKKNSHKHKFRTHRLENHMCKLDGLLIMLINMNIWFLMMGMLKTLELHVEMDCVI